MSLSLSREKTPAGAVIWSVIIPKCTPIVKLTLFIVAVFTVSWCASAQAQGSDAGHEIATDLRAGAYEKARDVAIKALRSSPNDARLWTLKGVALVQLGDQTGALTCFIKSLSIAPEYLPALEGMAQIQYQTEPSLAVPFLRRILRLHPADAASHAMLAQIALQAGNCETARSESALSEPDAPEAVGLKQFALCLVKQKKATEAIPVFEHLAASQPDEQTLYYLGIAQFLAGRFSDVVKTLGPIAEKDSARGATLEVLAEAYDFSSDSVHALETLKRAIAAQPDVPEYYTDFAYMCQAHGWFQQGIEMLNRGLEKIPVASLYVARGVLFSELANWDQGEADFQKANTMDPNVAFGSAAKGLAELQQNDLSNAESTARERLKQHPNDAFLHYLLAEVLAKKGAVAGSPEFLEAVRSATEAVRIQPDLLLARNVLARLYLESGDLEQSAQQSRIVYRANPTDQTALYHLILALRKAGHASELPELMKQLAQLKERSRKQDELARKTETVP